MTKSLDETRGASRKILVALLLCTLAGNMVFTNVAALLPPYAEENHPRFNSFSIGILFSSYQIALIFAAPWIGSNLHKYGRRSALLVSIYLLSISTIVFGAAGFIKHDWGWYGVSFLARTVQGLGDAVLCITVPSIISLEYTEKQEIYLGYASAFLGLSYMVSPALAGVIYVYVDYVYTMLIFGVIILVCGVGSICMIPSRVNKYEVLDASGAATNEEVQDIPYSALFSNKRSAMGVFAKFMGAFCFNFYDPILSLYLENGRGMEPTRAFLGFSVSALGLTIGSALYGKWSAGNNLQCLLFFAFVGLSCSVYVSGGLE